MPSALKFLVDNSGHKASVLLPLKVWDLNANYQKLQNKLDIFSSIRQELNEVKQAKRTGKKLQTLNDFLKRL